MTDLVRLFKSAIDLFVPFPKDRTPHFCTVYLDDYDEYMVYCCVESPAEDSRLFTIEMAAVSPDPSHVFSKKIENKLIEVDRWRFNLDFGLDFRLLLRDEKRFFMSAYCHIVAVKKAEKESAPGAGATYNLTLGRFKTESVLHRFTGSTYRTPVVYELLSDGKKPVGIKICSFDVVHVQTNGCFLAINPSTPC